MVRVDSGIGVILQQGDGEAGADLAAGGPADHGSVPFPEYAQADALGTQDLPDADGGGVTGHILNGAAQVADGVRGAGLGADGQHPGGQGGKFRRAQIRLGLIEGQVA